MVYDLDQETRGVYVVLGMQSTKSDTGGKILISLDGT